MERLIDLLMQYIQQDPVAIAKLLMVSAVLHLGQFLLTLFIVARVSHIENCMKDKWPDKFNWKL